MTSYLHEGIVALLRERPSLVAELVRSAFSIDVDASTLVQPDAADLTSLAPAERRADLVLLCANRCGGATYGLIAEVQLAPDPDKPFRWPAYAAVLRDRRRCPVDVVVVCVDEGLARSLAEPVSLGRGGSVFRPLVLGPGAVPVVTDLASAARDPELAVLSALSHRNSEAGVDVAFTAATAASGLDEGRRGFYVDLVLGALSETARLAVEALMLQNGYQYQTEFARTYFAKGKAEGEAKGKAEGEAKGAAQALLAVLEARGLRVSEAQRARILGCTDTDQLERWVRRAVTVKTTGSLLAATGRRKPKGQ